MIEDSIGRSKYTPLKQERFGQFLDWHMNISSDPYWYIDMTAGSGIYYDYQISPAPIIGSPLQFLSRTGKREFRADLIERNAESAKKLEQTVKATPHTTVYNCTNGHVLMQKLLSITDYVAGLIYCDEQPSNIDLAALMFFASGHPDMDILLHFQAGALKRNSEQTYTLVQVMQMLGRTDWSISAPETKGQWVFLYGTNKAASQSKTANPICASIHTPEGQSRLKKVMLPLSRIITREEVFAAHFEQRAPGTSKSKLGLTWNKDHYEQAAGEWDIIQHALDMALNGCTMETVAEFVTDCTTQTYNPQSVLHLLKDQDRQAMYKQTCLQSA